MGRLRARLAASEADRDMHTHIAQAERSLGLALHACSKVINTNRRRGVESRRAKDAHQVIRRALSFISGIGYLTPRIDMEDPDLLPEDIRADIARRNRDKPVESPQEKFEVAPQQGGDE